MNKILVVADIIEDTPVAIRQACEMAKIYNAHLHIVHFCFVNMANETGDVDEIKNKVVHAVRAQAQQLIKDTIEEGISYDHDVEWCKHIYQWVNSYAAAERPCLVVKTGHRSESAFYTPTDWHILRDCNAPILLAPESRWRKGTNVLAAIDLGTRNPEKLALNEKILDQAKRMADHFGSEFHVCYSPSAPPLLRDLGIRFPEDVEAEVQSNLKTKISQIASKYGIPENNIHIKAGVAEKVVPSVAAAHKAALVVIGVLGKSGIENRVIGNTAEKILSLLKTDVLALKLY